MKTFALLVVPVLAPVLTACLDTSAPAPEPGTPTTPIAFGELDAGGEVAIATGGVQVVTIADPLAVGLSGQATSGYELVPHAGAWPNAEVPTYELRALADGHGAFSIATARGVAAGAIDSADVARVVVQPAAYQLDGHSAFALDAARPAIEVALFDATDRRLVDGSLAIAGATQTAWDQASVAGATTITVTADSFAPTTAQIAVTSTVDRVEQVMDEGRVCYHAYSGNVEVAAAMPAVVSPDPAATNCESK